MRQKSKTLCITNTNIDIDYLNTTLAMLSSLQKYLIINISNVSKQIYFLCFKGSHTSTTVSTVYNFQELNMT